MNTRVITLFSTKGGKKKIESAATTWGELQTEVSGAGYDLNNLQATENVNKTTLMHPEAVLPEGNFVLFLRPVKTKSGFDAENASYKELKEEVKSNEDLKTFLNSFAQENGKSAWVYLTSALLREGILAYQSQDGAASEEVAEEVEESKEEAVQEETATEEVADEAPKTPIQKVDDMIASLESICDEIDDVDVCDRADAIIEDLKGLKEELEIHDKDAEARAADEAETERLENEYKDFFKGF